jgi:hypothetical protein
MIFPTTFCGRLVAVAWMACAAWGLFYVYLLLTFYIFTPVPISVNFRQNRFAIIAWSFEILVYLTGAAGVWLGRQWAKTLSFLLCAIGVLYGVYQFFIAGPLNFSAGVAVVFVLLSIVAWLFSRGARTYFHQADQPA